MSSKKKNIIYLDFILKALFVLALRPEVLIVLKKTELANRMLLIILFTKTRTRNSLPVLKAHHTQQSHCIRINIIVLPLMNVNYGSCKSLLLDVAQVTTELNYVQSLFSHCSRGAVHNCNIRGHWVSKSLYI